MRSFAIDQVTNDLVFDAGGSLVMVTDALAVGQHARQRLLTFEDEWFLDTEAGVPWLGQILGKHYNAALAEAVTKAEILDTPGVTEITSFSVVFDIETRGLHIRDVAVSTIYDEVTQV